MGCPEVEQVIGVMAGTERAGWVDHAAGCDECRAVGIVMGYLPDPAESGPRVGRYILGEVVGRGAMGVVYAARDPELEREVAVKVHATARPGRLRREARALARLSHPNVVQVHDVGEHDGRAFVAMELVDGESLRDWLRTPRS
ncbi:MAG TPA: protein kinase, partial [Kofleriaceae bacterium]